ncbi:MAG: hypothetical protein ACXVEF_13735 [Polyangiales bacterium]
MAKDSNERTALPFVAACVPIALAILCDPESRGFDGGARGIVLGLALGGDRSLAAPIAQLLAPLGTLLPVGHAELRAAIALSIPAAIATYLVARRIARVSLASGPWTSFAIVLAFGTLTGALLGAAPPEAAIAAIAVELLLLREIPAIGVATTILALWCAPRLSPAVLLIAFLTLRQRRPRHGLLATVVLLLPFVAILVARDSTAWLVVGKPFQISSWSRALDPAALRAAIATFVLAIAARFLSRAPSAEDRTSAWTAIAAFSCAFVLSAPGGIAVAASVAAPLAAASASAIALLVDRKLAGSQRAVAALVPALCLGLAARAIEVDLGARRLGLAASAAHDVAAIVTTGIAPPRAVFLVEDEAALLAFARDRLLHGLRPDLHVLPAQSLLAGGAARMATRTLAEVPGSNETLRALLARGVIDGADLAPLAQRAPVLDGLPAARVKLVARHAASTGGPLLLALERVDPSDRRLRQLAIERRLAALAGALAPRPANDRVRRALRVDATREARVLSSALDRDATLAAIGRARAFGAPEDRSARWLARTLAKQTLDSEPLTEDD